MNTTTLRPLLGTAWPEQGGIFAAITPGVVIDGIQQPDVALITPNGPAGHFKDVEWGPIDMDIAGATSPTDGAANTAAMAAAGSELAKSITNLNIEGHADWFLPARRQLQAIAASVPQLFDEDDWYWTSTQLSRHSAVVQGFEYGGSHWGTKDNEFRAVAVRQIPLL